MRAIGYIAFFFFSLSAVAQTSNYRCKWVLNPNVAFQVDTLSLVPESITITSGSLENVSFTYDPTTNEILPENASFNDSLYICYRVLPFNLSEERKNRDVALYDSLKVFRDNLHYDSPYLVHDEREELFSSPGLNKTGNLSRGISFGNNQNVGVNSNLNIQLEGKLTDDVSILGSISDQNIPFQPEGNTATLQEFDRVYIKLFTDQTELSAGDLRLTNKENSYFLKYLKNVQGGQLTTKYGSDTTYVAETSVGAAISKGKFNSIILDAVEGVQGPYKLRGPDGERFVVVIANSEKVFLDGEQLRRGFDFDYVIDYNNGEITFTNNVVITRFSRIRVDFEYSDLNYSRTTINGSHYQTMGSTDFYANYYSEKDNRNNPLNVDLENSDKEILANAGDNPFAATTPGFDETDFSQDRVLYKTDTVDVDGTPTPIFVYSTNPDSAQYEVRFSLVGAGNGNYVKENTTANGVVYKFVFPVGGEPQGEYEPVQLLPAPQKKQMVTAGLEHRINKTETIKGEFAFSDVDRNLFSEIDNDDNQGYAYVVGVNSKGRKVLESYELNTGIDFEYNHENFNRIDRFRYIEFDRDWSANTAVQGQNIFVNGNIGIKKNKDNLVDYSISFRDKENDVTGTQQRFIINKSFDKVFLRSNGFFLNSKTSSTSSKWDRLTTDLSWRKALLTTGVKYALDKNVITNAEDEVVGTAMYYDAITGYLQTSDTSKVFTAIDYTYREDSDTLKDRMSLSTVAHTANITVKSNYGQGSLVKLKTTYRQLENVGAFAYLENDRTLMNRLDWNTGLFKRMIRSELTLSSITAREARRDFLYLPIFDGSGTHVYVGDLNDIGVRDIDEFSLKGETILILPMSKPLCQQMIL